MTSVAQLQEQVATLEELLQIYEQAATENEQRLQDTLRTLEEKARQLEHAQSALQTLETILDSMGDAVLVVDKAGHALFSNPAAKQLLNDEFLLCPTQLPKNTETPTKDKPSIGSEYHYAIEALPLSEAILGKAVNNAEMQITQQGEEKPCWLNVNARPLKSGGQVTGAVAVFRDVTQSKRSEQALQQSNEEFLQQSQVLKTTLHTLQQTQVKLIHEEKMAGLAQTVAGIAHEINNPISFIHGNIAPLRRIFQDLLNLITLFEKTYPEQTVEISSEIEAIELDFIGSDLPKIFTSMEVGTRRIREIVKSLRVFAHLDEAGVKAVDIHQGIDSACMILQSKLQAQPHGTPIKINKVYGDIPRIECHAGQINQVFIHLLSNAVDALSSQTESPEISIYTEGLNGQIIIRISDNGAGIPKVIQNKVFDPFFTTKPIGSGAGLGLSVCHQVVVGMHQGSIELISEEKQGTEVVINLPY